MTPRTLRNWIYLGLLSIIAMAMACQCFGQPTAEPTAVGLAFQDGNGWTEVPYPPAGQMIFVDQDGGNDANDGFDPHGFGLSTATYTHSSRTLTSSGAFSGYTHTGGDRTDVIYLFGAAGSGVDDGWYVIESKTSNDAIVLEAADGLTGDDTSIASSSGPKSTLAAGVALLTDGASDDQLLCQRGDTWTDEEIDIGGGRALTGSSGAPILFGVYGPISDGRAVIRQDDTTNQKAFLLSSAATFNHVYIIGYECQPNNKVAANFNAGISVTASGTTSDILIEDCYVHESGTNIIIQGSSGYDIPNVTIRNCVITDAWNDNQEAQGIFTKFVDGLVVENCIFDKNGWVTSGTLQTGTGSQYNHSAYISDGTKNISFRYNISSQSALNGIKLDCFDTTARVYDNCIANPRFAGQIGVGDEDGDAGSSTGNYLYLWNNTADGYHNGFHVTNVAGGYFRNNIMGPRGFLSGFDNGDPYAKSQYLIKFSETALSPGVGVNNYTEDGNIYYNARGPINCDELPVTTYGQWSNVVFSNNDHIEPDTDKAFRQIDSGLDITFSNNNYYSVNTSDPANRFDVDGTKQSFAWWQSNYEATATNVNTSYTDPGRTCEEYATDATNGLGLANLAALHTLWRAERRGNWNTEYHAQEINDYIRAGYGMSEYTPPTPSGSKKVLILQ